MANAVLGPFLVGYSFVDRCGHRGPFEIAGVDAVNTAQNVVIDVRNINRVSGNADALRMPDDASVSIHELSLTKTGYPVGEGHYDGSK